MKYIMNCQVTVSAWTEVEAESLEEAQEIAASRDVVLDGGNFSSDEHEESWVIQDADGSPEKIRWEGEQS